MKTRFNFPAAYLLSNPGGTLPSAKYSTKVNVDDYSLIAYGFQAALGQAEGFYSLAPLAFFQKFPYRNQALRVLDLGCGVGRFLADLAGYYPQASFLGLDYSAAMLTRAKEMLLEGAIVTVCRATKCFSLQGSSLKNIELRQGDAQQLPFPDQLFDCVNASNLLDRVPDAAVVLREMVRVLRPGGMLLLTSPLNFAGFPQATPYTKEELVTLLQQQGVEITKLLDNVPYQEYVDERNTRQWNSVVIQGVKRGEALCVSAPTAIALSAQAQTYQAVFEGEPWQEQWPLERAYQRIQHLLTLPTAEGEILHPQTQDTTLGFWYGHSLSEQADYPQLQELTEANGSMFYLAEFGVHPTWQGRKLGKQLMARLVSRHPRLLTRTLNPLMVSLLQKGFSKVEVIWPHLLDSEHPTRRWYLCEA